MKNLRKIAIVGVEGSGKTVLLASLGGYYTQATNGPVFLNSNDEDTQAYILRQINKIQQKEWPVATESQNIKGLDWLLRRRGKGGAPEDVCELSCLDFGGEVYRAAYGSDHSHDSEDLTQEVARLKDFIRSADGVVVLVNLGDVITHGLITPRVSESMRISNSILNDVLNRTGRGRKKKVHAAIALSQSDNYLDIINRCGGAYQTLAKYLPEVYNQYQYLDVFCTNSVETELSDDGIPCPTGKFSAAGLRDLMNWIVACAEGRISQQSVTSQNNDFSLGEDDRSGKVKKVYLAEDVPLELVYCAPSSFVMGSPENEDGRTSDDETQHQVELTQGFWIGKYPITQEQWQCVMRTDPSYRKDPKCPVESVSWNDCREFLAKLNDRNGKVAFRLPTEAEWEYACRAKTDKPFGNDPIDDVAWYRDNAVVQVTIGAEDKSELQTHPVGLKKPNRIGICDMHGNVWEWCADFYGEYPESAVTDPTGPAEGVERVVRGGAYNNAANFCRAAYRQRHASDYKMRNLGFRVCFTALESEDGLARRGGDAENARGGAR